MGLYETPVRVLTILGTRPEAIKLAPVLRVLGRKKLRVESIVAVTGQHRQMLDQVLTLFRIVPDIDLNLMQANQGVGDFAAHAFAGVNAVLDQVRPDVVIVQGDTTSAAVAAQAAFYRRVPVAHVEAGLRTGDPANPFPEEINRRLIDVLARYLFAPTPAAAATLRREGHPGSSIHMTGNTVVDALYAIVRRRPGRAPARPRQPLIVVTSHRREHFGEPLRRICQSLIAIARRRPDVRIVFPVHLNPNVRAVTAELLGGQDRIELIEPLPYDAFIRLMAGASLVITDSGGIQEEAPALGVPVVVIRETTERMEAVRAGAARIAGTTVKRIVTTVLSELGGHHRRRVRNVFGDGRAAERIVRVLVAEHGRPAARPRRRAD
jgi:UDP-N-acetylglucosamine 2-epimerase (non-hydrolysing)